MNFSRLLLFCLAITFLSCKLYQAENISGKNENEESIQGHQSGAGLAIEAWASARFGGDEFSVPATALLDAHKQLNSSFRAKDFAQWKALGPKNIGGRTLCLAFHPTEPNTIYAGSASGGLWRTFSAGVGYNGWLPVPINLPVYSIASLLISKSNPNVLLAGTGEVYNKDFSIPGIIDRTTRGTYGMGIIKSTDAGKTWSQVLNLNQGLITGVQDMKFDPYDDQIVYAATTHGVYKSTNQGKTWTLIHNIPMAVDIELNPKNPEIIYVTHGSYKDRSISGIYRSNNSGGNFIKLVNGLPESYSGKAKLDISKSNPDILYASIADESKSIGLFFTIDGGNTWDKMTDKDVANVQGWYSHDVAIHATNPDFISYVGQNVYISDSRGHQFINVTSWDAGDMGRVPVGGAEGIDIYVHADVHATYFHPQRPDEIYFATDGGIFVSKDKGLTFEGRNGGYQTSQFYANFSASKTDPKFAIGGMQDNGTAIYDGQDGWIKVIGGDGMSTAIHPNNDNILFGSFQYFGLNKSTDKGKTFEFIRPNNTLLTSEAKAFNTPFEITTANPNTLYAGAQKVYINEKNGDPNSWKALHTNALDNNATVLALAVSSTDPTLIIASTGPLNGNTIPKLFRSTNGGATWTQVTGLPVKSVMDIAFDPLNGQIVYIAVSGFGKASHVFKSLNGGLTWTNIDGSLPDVPTNCIAINPNNPKEIYVGNDLGVFVSGNGGQSWDKFMEGLPSATMAMSLSISPAQRVIKVATHGHGVYESPLVDLALANKENDFKAYVDEVSLSPNPTTTHSSLAASLKFKSDLTITVSNLNGQPHFKSTVKGIIGTYTYSLERINLSSGTYLVTLDGIRIADHKKFSITKKLVKL